MRHLGLCVLFSSWLLQCVSTESNRKLYQRGEIDPSTATPRPPVDNPENKIKLVDKHGRSVRLRLFIDNFQLVVSARSGGMSAPTEEELYGSWNSTSEDVVLGAQRLHELVDRQLGLWKTRYQVFDQLNTSRTLSEVLVKRVPYKSIKLEFKIRKRAPGVRHERLEEGQSEGERDALRNCLQGDLDSCSEYTDGNSDTIAWFLLACIVAQILTVLSVFGIWSPMSSIHWLGSTYEAISNDMGQLSLRLSHLLLIFVYPLGRKALFPLVALFRSILRIFKRRKTSIYNLNHQSRFPPFIPPGSPAGDLNYLHLPEGPGAPTSPFSSFSSFSSELPFLRRPAPDRSFYNPVNFDLVRSLGEGYFGKVVQLQHRENGQMVAVKIMNKGHNKHRLDSNGTLSNSASQHQAYSTDGGGTVDLDTVYGEIRAMLRVQNSPFAEWSPTVLSTYYNEDSYFIVMPFYERGDIIDCMKRGGGCVSRGLAKYYIAELISAIHFLHTLRIVHRDIKPENILLGIDGRIVVADLGIAHVFKEAISLENSPKIFDGPITSPFRLPSSDSAVWLDDDDYVKWEEGKKKGGDDFPFLNASTDNPHIISGEHGTPMYAAPEVFSGGKYSYGVDYYSMGMVYHQMVTGYLPLADGGPIGTNEPGSDRRWILDLGRHDLHLQVLSTKERSFLEKVLQEDPFERPSVSKMKADPLFADTDWDNIGQRKGIVPPALRIRRRGSLELATARCESEGIRFDSSSTCSVDSNIE